jgi:hypothetical protein
MPLNAISSCAPRPPSRPARFGDRELSADLPGVQSLIAKVIQNELDRGGQVFKTRLAGLSLSVGFRHLWAEGDEPFPIPMHHRRASVSRDSTPLDRLRPDNPNAVKKSHYAISPGREYFSPQAWYMKENLI